MATLYSNSTGNFTSAAVWSVVEPSTFQSLIATQETGTTASTTAFVSSTSFTGVSSTLDGMALKISSRSGAPTGTFSVRLAVAGVAVTNTTVTVNVADIPNGISWIFFKFPANVTLVGATTYTFQLDSSTNAQVTSFRKSATAADWTFALRTTTTQAPAAGDSMIVGGEWDSAGVNSTWTVTMNNTAATQFGSGTTGTAGLSINANSIFTWGTAAATAYVLNLAGSLYINNAGIYRQGTVGTPIPSGSSGKLNLVQTVNVQFGVEARAGATFSSGGNPITNNALLAADAAATATSLTTNVSTGWKNGDSIVLASTTRTAADSENKSLTADAVTTTLTISAITNAHSGTSPTQGELINLTRNVQMFGTSTSLQAYISINATATVDLEATEFFNMGSATALKRGIDVATTTGSCTINNCSIHDFVVASSIGINVTGGTSNNYTLTNNVIYNTASSAVINAATSGTTYTINNIIAILTGATAFSISDLTGTITNLTGVSATGAGITLADNAATTTEIFGTLNGFTSHSNTTIGTSLVNITGVTNNPMALISNITTWRNNGGANQAGLNLSNSFTLIVDTVTAFGNNTANINIGGTECDNIYLKNMTINAGTTFVSPVGFNVSSDCHEIYIDSSTFGATTTHATGDINISSTNLFPRLVTRNTTLSSPTNIASPGNMTEGGFVSLAKLNTTAGNHKTFRKYGTIAPDTVIFNSAGTSTRLTPNNGVANNKLQGTVRRFAVVSGQTSTVTVFVRKSVAGDGTAYNGNQPQLMLRVDPAVGLTANNDTVLATSTVAGNGAFEKLVGVTPAITDNAAFQIYVQCDGNLGWVNVDDWSVQ